MRVLLDDDLGRLTLRRLRPWHRLLAPCLAARLDRDLAGGASPESSALLAVRAMRLTSMTFRRELAASLRRVLTPSAGCHVSSQPSLSAARALSASARRACRCAGRESASSARDSRSLPTIWW